MLYLEKLLAVFDGLAIFDEDLDDDALHLGLDFVHDLHRLDDAHHRVLNDLGAVFRIGLTLWRAGTVKGTHHWGLNINDACIVGSGHRGGGGSRSRSGGGCRSSVRHFGDRRAETTAAANHWKAISTPADLQLKALFLDREFGQFGARHEVNDLFDLFKVQGVLWLREIGLRFSIQNGHFEKEPADLCNT